MTLYMNPYIHNRFSERLIAGHTNTANSVRSVRNISSLLFFENQYLFQQALAPYGFVRDGYEGIELFHNCDYSSTAILLDFCSAIFDQLLPTAIWNMIADDFMECSNESIPMDAVFWLKCFKHIVIDYPLCVIVFALRIVSTILLAPSMYIGTLETKERLESHKNKNANKTFKQPEQVTKMQFVANPEQVTEEQSMANKV